VRIANTWAELPLLRGAPAARVARGGKGGCVRRFFIIWVKLVSFEKSFAAPAGPLLACTGPAGTGRAGKAVGLVRTNRGASFLAGRYGRGLPGFVFLVSLWSNSRCQSVGGGWGQAGGVCDDAALVLGLGGSSCARLAPAVPWSRSLPPSGSLSGVVARPVLPPHRCVVWGRGVAGRGRGNAARGAAGHGFHRHALLLMMAYGF
jgi:hypothetical protein